jgi:hypothetical protein
MSYSTALRKMAIETTKIAAIIHPPIITPKDKLKHFIVCFQEPRPGTNGYT